MQTRPSDGIDRRRTTAIAAAKQVDSQVGCPAESTASSGCQPLNTIHAPHQCPCRRMDAADINASDSPPSPLPALMQGPWLPSDRLIVPETACAVQCGIT